MVAANMAGSFPPTTDISPAMHLNHNFAYGRLVSMIASWIECDQSGWTKDLRKQVGGVEDAQSRKVTHSISLTAC